MKPLISLIALLSLPAQAGIFGSGNTADSSLQMNFTRSTAALLVKNVTVRDLRSVGADSRLLRVYEICRETMYLALLRAKIELVESIPDGGGQHALARRRDRETIEVSRTEIRRLLRSGQFTSPFLTALFVHEVGHDCVVDGKALGDEADPLLNELGLAVVEASGARSFASFLDIDFVERVERRESVTFAALSEKAKRELVERWADYLGDWAYLGARDAIRERPAPASHFFADARTSLFPGWGTLLRAGQVPGSLQWTIEHMLQASLARGHFFVESEGKARPLATMLSCRAVRLRDGAGADCELSVFADALADARLVGAAQRLRFTLDIFGNLKIEEIAVSHRL